MSTGASVHRVALIALVLAPAALSGQRLEYLGGGAGVLAPTGTFGDVDKVGWHLSAVGVGRLTGSLRFVVDAIGGQTAHRDGTAGGSTLAGGTVSAALLFGNEARRIRPLLLAGVGVFRVNVAVPGFGSAAATKFAPAAGAGLLVGTGRRRAFLVARYVSVSTSPQTTSFIPLSAGMVLAFGSQ